MLTGSSARLCVGVITPHELILEGLTTLLRAQDDRVAVVDAGGGLGSLADPAADPTLVLLDSGAGTRLRGVASRWVEGQRPLVVLDRAGEETGLGQLPPGTPVVPISARAEQLLEVLDRVAAGAVGASAHAGPPAGRTHYPAGLSSREAEVLGYVAAGLSNREIGDRLFLGVNTVKTYLRTGYAKAGITSRPQAVAWAIRHGLGPVPPHQGAQSQPLASGQRS